MKFTQANSPVGPLQNTLANYMSQQHQQNGNSTTGNSSTMNHQSGVGGPTAAEFGGPSINIKTKEKHSAEALRHFAKNTLRKAGLMPRANQRKLPPSMMPPSNSSSQQSQQSQQTKQPGQSSQIASRTPETIRKTMRHMAGGVASDFVEAYAGDGDEDSLSGIHKYMYIYNIHL